MTKPGVPKPVPPPGMKIRTNYVPKVKQLNRGKQAAQICPRCKQPVPTAEMGEHMRIELLDPKWKEQKDKAREKNKESNLSNTAVSSNLKLLAKTRPDIFGGDEFNIDKALKDAEKGKVIWDGHTASIGTVTQKLGHGLNWEEQQAEQQRAAAEEEARIAAIGPKVPGVRPASGLPGVSGSLPPVPPSMQHYGAHQAYAYPPGAPPPAAPGATHYYPPAPPPSHGQYPGVHQQQQYAYPGPGGPAAYPGPPPATYHYPGSDPRAPPGAPADSAARIS
ncbi:Pre-mRNA splicing factor PRP21 like protein-domain-containing protein [Geranomyces variabilis]|nr:Pre-mRNA splicing factor PRP21 like protein-domain-containing protein [Geranomyces variabilis]KAJ3136617.1 SF3a splicing factor complex subunit [Geranomyces variabilis]